MTQRVANLPARQRLPTQIAVALLCVSLAAGPAAQAQSPNARFRGEPVTLNFVNADIEGVTRAVGAILKQPFVVDPRVKGSITLYSEEPISPREVYLNYLAALRGLGFTVIEAGGLFKVVPEADAKLQTGTVSVGAVTRQGDQILTQIFRLNHESANNLVAVLRPLISPNNTINANPGNNTLVVTDYADNLQRIAKIIAAMDVPAGGDLEVIPLVNAAAADIAPLVQRLSEGASAVPGAAPTVGGATVLIDSRSNSLIVRAANPQKLASIKAIVEKLDRPIPGGNALGKVWVVYLKNADAVRLAVILRAVYTGAGGGTAASVATTSPLAGAMLDRIGAGPGGGTNVNVNTQATAPVSASAAPSTGGLIQADPATNSLIISAPEPVYRQLRAVIDQLDSRRAQVYIESMIVKVDANKAADFGFQWQAFSGQRGDNTIPAAGTNFGSGNSNIITASAAIAQGGAGLIAAAANPVPGFTFALLKKFGDLYTLGALARFLETNADANVLSTPNLIALDNEEAKITIGQNVPFVTGSFTNTGGSSGGSVNPFQTIERKDVGLTLRVKPQIGENGTVRLIIYQENSAVVSGASSPNGPTTDKSAIETTVVVDDGQIVVLGGLLKDEYNGSVSKVPFLGDLPVVGNLFRSDSRSRTKTNLMVFLRPVVIRDQETSNSLTTDRYQSIRAQQIGQQPAPRLTVPINDSPIIPTTPPPAGSMIVPPSIDSPKLGDVPAAAPN